MKRRLLTALSLLTAFVLFAASSGMVVDSSSWGNDSHALGCPRPPPCDE